MEYVLDNTSEIRNSANELLNRHTINRHFTRLLANDIKLNQLYEDVQSIGSNIRQFVEGTTYNKNDLVWIVLDTLGHPNQKSLYLLQSLVDKNTTTPYLVRTDVNQYSFEPSGWRDKNEYTTIYESTLSAQIMQEFVQYIDTYHQFEIDYHKYGVLDGTVEQFETKILRKDLSNIDPNRKNVFFPNKTIKLEPDNVILNGCARQWDNGLLEYEILFRLSYSGIEVIDGVEYEVLSCNSLDLSETALKENGIDVSIDNKKYFNDADAYKIFAQQCDSEIKIGTTIQKNRNDFANAYSGTIKFPIEFADTNYMIFNSDVRCQERNIQHQTIDHGANALVFTNKTTTSMTAVYVLVPIIPSNGGRKSGLISNSFHCQVIGKWK